MPANRSYGNSRILEGDCRDVLAELDAGSVQTCVTSPPYFGLRDYGTAGQLGLEPTPGEYVTELVDVFRHVRRVLRDDGTVWLNLGDSYDTGAGRNDTDDRNLARRSAMFETGTGNGTGPRYFAAARNPYKPKDLLGIPWMVAFALRTDGWYLRSDIIWSKPNPMPESVTDRPTKAHEYLFLLSKGPRYFYDADAIREPHTGKMTEQRFAEGIGREHKGKITEIAIPNGGPRWSSSGALNPAGRNRRSVWTVATQPYAGAHFATFPPKLIEPCILAGSAKGDVVLDPFAGAGTTGVVAAQHSREFIGVELNPAYAAQARTRIQTEGRPGARYHEPAIVHEHQLLFEGVA